MQERAKEKVSACVRERESDWVNVTVESMCTFVSM